MKGQKRADRRHRTTTKFIKRFQRHVDLALFESHMRDGHEHGWKDVEGFKKDNAWLIKLKNTGTLCSCDGCGNQRHNRHLKKKCRLTNQELRALEDFVQQIRDLINENFNS